MSYIFAFDCETTGLSVTHDRPMQIAFTLIEPGKEYQIQKYYVDPGKECHPKAREVHGITDEMAKSGLSLTQLGEMLKAIFAENKIDRILGINVLKYDIPLLYNSLTSVGIDLEILNKLPVDDPSAWYLADYAYKVPRPKNNDEYTRIMERFKPKGTRSNLTHLCEIYNILFENAHDAGGDLEASIQLWNKTRSPERKWPDRYVLSSSEDRVFVDLCGYGRIEIPKEDLKKALG